MKTETQIAQNNIGNFLSTKKDNLVRTYCKEHKATCQRFLEFLEALTKWGSWERMSIFAKQNVKDKITDLKQAIKLYEDAGI